MKIMFLDESGDHSLARIDAQYPVFVLGGIIADRDYAAGKMTQAINDFKIRLFGTKDTVMHTADIARNRNGFERLSDPDFRKRFYDELNHLMSSLEYKIAACAIRKDDHLEQHGLAALDPYMLSLEVLVERFAFEIGPVREGGAIVAEERGRMLDRQLDIAWMNLKLRGTRHLGPSKITERISSLTVSGKADMVAGLELADLATSPIGRHVLGRRPKPDFRIIERKFCRSTEGEYRGVGLVELPK